jgi:secreted trypsin-like serine protease
MTRRRILPRIAALLATVLATACVVAPTVGAAPHAASGRIVGGSKPADDVYQGRLRPLVALISMSAPDQYDGQFCGGTLIAPTVVLTAGHCLVDNAPFAYRSSPSSIGVLAGARSLKARTLDRSALVPVREIYVHPSFNLDTFRFDAALLRLSRPVTNVPTMPILTSDEAGALGIGDREVGALAAGWGDTDPTSDRCCYPTELQALNQTIHTTQACTSNLDRSSSLPFAADLQLCSGAIGRDTCQGDSGGPLVVDVAAAPRLAGIVSYGSGCGEGSYGIYTRASAMRDWVGALPGTTEGDARDLSHGFDDSTAPTLVGAVALDYSRVRITVAPGAGGTPVRYRAYERRGRPVDAQDVVLGGGPASGTFVVRLHPTRSKLPYTVVVRGVTANGETPPLKVRTQPIRDLVAPSRPRSIAARTTGPRVVVTWRTSTDRQGGVASYEVQRRSGGRWSATSSVPHPSTRLVVRGAGHGQVRVRARDLAGNASGWATASY